MPRFRRSFRSSRSYRRRTGRNVWVYARHLATSPAGGLEIVDLLSGLDTALQRDSTIVRVLGSWVVSIADATATPAAISASEACGLITGMSTLDAADFAGADILPASGTPNATPKPFMWRDVVEFQTTDNPGAGVQVVRPIDVRAKRRFRENGETLWLVHNSATTTGLDAYRFSFNVSILLRVP